MSKALVISGGGAKGAYAVGFLDHIQNVNPSGLPDFSIYVGTSTGALIVPFMALNKLPDLVDIFTTTEDADVMFQRDLRGITSKLSFFNTDPLKDLINDRLSDGDCARLIGDGTKQINLLATCLQTKRLTVFTTATNLTSTAYDVIIIDTPAVLKAAMLASANQPIIMPPIQVNRDSADGNIRTLQYVDGGLVEYVGTEIAMNAGAQNILTILLSSGLEEPSKKPLTSLLAIAGASLSTFTEDVGRNDLRIPSILNDGLTYLSEIKAKLLALGVEDFKIEAAFSSFQSSFFDRDMPHNLHTVRPSKKLFSGIEALKFKPENMKKMLALGAKDATDYLISMSARTDNFIV